MESLTKLYKPIVAFILMLVLSLVSFLTMPYIASIASQNNDILVIGGLVLFIIDALFFIIACAITVYILFFISHTLIKHFLNKSQSVDVKQVPTDKKCNCGGGCCQ